MTDEVFATIFEYVAKIHPGNRPERIKILLADGSKIDLKFPAVFQPKPQAKPGIKHSIDFRSLSVNGQVYSFTPTQAAIVRLLVEAHENGTPDVSGDTLLEHCNSTSSQIKDVFRNNDAWGTLIVPGVSKGTYRLSLE